MKNSLCFVLALFLGLSCLLCACGSGSSGSEKVYTYHESSFSLPSSWRDNSTGDSAMYSAPDDSAGLNISFDDSENRTVLSDRLQGVDYDLDSVSVDGEEVRLYMYQQDGFWFHDFEVLRDDGAYHFVFIASGQKPAEFDVFVSSLMF